MIVTVSNSFVSRPIAVCFKVFNLQAVELENVENHYTGQVLDTPTFREGKIIRLMDWLQETGHFLERSYFYSDSYNDLPLLQLVENSRAFDPDLILCAPPQAENWPVLQLHSSDYPVGIS